MKNTIKKCVLACANFFFILSLPGCHAPVAEYKINSGVKLPSYNSTFADSLHTPLNLCQLFDGKWDSILVVNPYIISSSIKSLDIKNYGAISSKVELQSFGDMTCTLLFTYKGVYVGYNALSRGTIDFVPFVSSKKSQYTFIKKSECKEVQVVLSSKKHRIISELTQFQ